MKRQRTNDRRAPNGDKPRQECEAPLDNSTRPPNFKVARRSAHNKIVAYFWVPVAAPRRIDNAQRDANLEAKHQETGDLDRKKGVHRLDVH